MYSCKKKEGKELEYPWYNYLFAYFAINSFFFCLLHPFHPTNKKRRTWMRREKNDDSERCVWFENLFVMSNHQDTQNTECSHVFFPFIPLCTFYYVPNDGTSLKCYVVSFTNMNFNQLIFLIFLFSPSSKILQSVCWFVSALYEMKIVDECENISINMSS